MRLALRTGAPIVPVAMVGAHRVVDRHRLVPTLVLNLVRRPKVNTRIGEPIDIRELMNIGPSTQPTNEEVRLAADLVMGRLVAVVADFAVSPHPARTASSTPRLTLRSSV